MKKNTKRSFNQVNLPNLMLSISYILNPGVLYFNPDLSNFALILILFFLLIPIQVLFEKLFFRGYLNQGLALKIKSPVIVILISFLIFLLGHMSECWL